VGRKRKVIRSIHRTTVTRKRRAAATSCRRSAESCWWRRRTAVTAYQATVGETCLLDSANRVRYHKETQHTFRFTLRVNNRLLIRATIDNSRIMQVRSLMMHISPPPTCGSYHGTFVVWSLEGGLKQLKAVIEVKITWNPVGTWPRSTPDSWGRLGNLAAWHLPDGPVGSPASWATILCAWAPEFLVTPLLMEPVFLISQGRLEAPVRPLWLLRSASYGAVRNDVHCCWREPQSFQ